MALPAEAWLFGLTNQFKNRCTVCSPADGIDAATRARLFNGRNKFEACDATRDASVPGRCAGVLSSGCFSIAASDAVAAAGEAASVAGDVQLGGVEDARGRAGGKVEAWPSLVRPWHYALGELDSVFFRGAVPRVRWMPRIVREGVAAASRKYQCVSSRGARQIELVDELGRASARAATASRKLVE